MDIYQKNHRSTRYVLMTVMIYSFLFHVRTRFRRSHYQIRAMFTGTVGQLRTQTEPIVTFQKFLFRKTCIWYGDANLKVPLTWVPLRESTAQSILQPLPRVVTSVRWM